MRFGRRRNLWSWLSLGALLFFCGLLGFLQFRWIGEVSLAEGDRLRANLRASLDRLNRDFTSEVAAEYRAIVPFGPGFRADSLRATLAANIARWKNTSHRPRLFGRIGLLEPVPERAALYVFDFDAGAFRQAPWPEEWAAVRDRILAMGMRGPFAGRGPGEPMQSGEEYLFAAFLGGMAPLQPGAAAFGSLNAPRVLFELDRDYLREEMLPELVHRHLGSEGGLEYEVAVAGRGPVAPVVYESSPGQADRIARQADVTGALFEPPSLQGAPFRSPAGPGEGARGRLDPRFPQDADAGGVGPRAARGGPGGGPGGGRWLIYVHHKAGSLEAVVARARTRNLAVAGAVLLLLLASVGALIRYSRRAQKLADLQMEFVAGIGHELRTPLTVINTAAYNLRGKLAQDPAQVEKYGTLIRKETSRLTDIVEQVLRFAGSEAGRVLQSREPVLVDIVLEEAVESTRAIIEDAGCRLERDIEPDLPAVLGDAAALKRVFSNLLSNAAKHGAGDRRWIGLRASRVTGKDEMLVEVRVADRGLGIPAAELKRIFEPFVRGERASRDQVHGSGLGLHLVKKIVEAHGGTVQATSVPGDKTELIVRLPVMPTEAAP